MTTRTRTVLRIAIVAVVGALVIPLLAVPPRAAERQTFPKPRPKPTEVPTDWVFSRDGIDKFPLLDFTPKEAGKPKPDDKKLAHELSKRNQEIARLVSEKKWKEARRTLDGMLKEHGDHHITGDALHNYISHLSHDKVRKDEALDLCRILIRRFPNYAWSAYHHIQRITGTRLHFYNYGRTSVEPGTTPTIHINGHNISRVKFTVYKVDLFAMLKAGNSLLAPTIPKGAKPVKTWTHKPKHRARDDQSFSENVQIPVTEQGAYIVTLGTEHFEWTTLLFVTRLAVAAKGDGRILMAYASDMRGGKAPGACEIAILDNTRVIHRGTTSADGLFVGRVKGQARNGFVVLRRGEDWAVSHAHSYYSTGSYGRIHIYTDRPVYRPNQTVHLKCLLRRFNYQTDDVEFKPGEELQVLIRDPKWNEVLKKTVKTGEFGTAELSMTLGDEPPLGFYHVNVGGPNAHGSFRFSVQEYKKPEYEVTVVTDAAHAIIGEEVKAAVSARYYFGEPVKGAEVSYEVYANPHYYYYPWWRHRHPYYWFAEEYYRPHRPRIGGTMIARGKGKLDDEGKIELTVDTSKLERKKGYDYDLSIRASVTDKSRRQIQGYGSVRLARAGLQLSVHADRYSYRPGDKVSANVRTTDLGGKGLSAAVKLRIQRQSSDGKYKASFEDAVETNADGHAVHTFVPDQNGYYQIVATAKDKAGNEVSHTVWLWVAGEGWRSPYRYSGIDIKTDRELYQPGDKAQVLITTGYVDHPALVTVEGDRIHSYRLARFNGSLLTQDVAVQKAFAPMSHVTAMLFADGAYVNRQQVIVVPPADKWLKVAIAADQPQYKPGEIAMYTLTLTDHSGEPVVAELSFGLVDEAIYAIQPDKAPDVRKFFYGQRRRYIYTQTSFNFRSRGIGGAQGERQQANAPAEGFAEAAALGRV
ncbi:MG2 domain-containing protein, partial [Planctomycetota bacterium]